MDFHQEMLKSARALVNLGLTLRDGDLQAAFAYAKEKSCAGPRIWAALELEFGA